jgi:DNA-binding transcriptional regulator YdaS (Cro superfamily)
MRVIDSETTALAIVFGNTQRKKRKEDLVTIAKAFEYLIKMYGSQKAVAEKIGLSSSMVGQFISVLRLPEEVQKLIIERKIDSVDIAKEIAALGDTSKQIAAAEAVVSSLSKDVRDIKRLIKRTNIDAKGARKVIINEKGFNLFIMDFDDDTYRALKKHSRSKGITPAELVKGIVEEWLKKHDV